MSSHGAITVGSSSINSGGGGGTIRRKIETNSNTECGILLVFFVVQILAKLAEVKYFGYDRIIPMANQGILFGDVFLEFAEGIPLIIIPH